jgi:hypothetical protein
LRPFTEPPRAGRGESGWAFVVPAEPDHLPKHRDEPPTFSVVVPVYQGAETVADAVESVLAQTVPPYEIIVCDDGSTDALPAALDPYRDRIVLLHQDHRGVAAARNMGLRRAAGEFVAVCDADDRYLPRLLEALGQLALARPDLDILCVDAYIEAGGRTLGRGRPDPRTFVVDNQRTGILANNFVPGRSAVRRLRLADAGGYDESLECAEDWDVWIRVILAGARAGLVDEPLACTRLRAGSLTSSPVRLLRGQVVALGKALAREDLGTDERQVAGRKLDLFRRALAVAEARVAVASRMPDARRQSLRVALERRNGLGTRAKAVAAVLAPRWASRRAGQQSGFDSRVAGALATGAATNCAGELPTAGHGGSVDPDRRAR